MQPDLEIPGRRQTGAVSLILTGERALPITGDQILAKAAEIDFTKGAELREDYEGGSIIYQSPPLRTDAIDTAFVEGLVGWQFSISGKPPVGFESLAEGTYVFFVDFVEGPDWDEPRWVGRVVDSRGTIARMVLGIEMKRVWSFSMSEADHADHGKPAVHTHGIASEAVALKLGEQPGGGQGDTPKWIVTSLSWKPVGTKSCLHEALCVPKQQNAPI